MQLCLEGLWSVPKQTSIKHLRLSTSCMLPASLDYPKSAIDCMGWREVDILFLPGTPKQQVFNFMVVFSIG